MVIFKCYVSGELIALSYIKKKQKKQQQQRCEQTHAKRVFQSANHFTTESTEAIRIKCHTSILVVWLECRFQNTEVDSSNPGNSMLCP